MFWAIRVLLQKPNQTAGIVQIRSLDNVFGLGT